MLEYTILVALIALVVVGAMTALGGGVKQSLPEGVGPTTTLAGVTTTSCVPPTTTSSTSSTVPGGC